MRVHQTITEKSWLGTKETKRILVGKEEQQLLSVCLVKREVEYFSFSSRGPSV